MTELERASEVEAKIKELDDYLKGARDQMEYAIKHGDEISKNAWARKIKEIRQERHNLHESVKYVRLKTFTEVIKTYLTPDDYSKAWRQVDMILEHPELMQ